MPPHNESSVKIMDWQWRHFWSWMEGYNPTSDKEQLFIQRWLQEENANKMWITVFRDVLSEALNFRTLGIAVL